MINLIVWKQTKYETKETELDLLMNCTPKIGHNFWGAVQNRGQFSLFLYVMSNYIF